MDAQEFSDDGEARLVADLRDALADNPGGEAVALAELREVATQMPAVGRALLALHRRHAAALEQIEAMAAELGDGRGDIARAQPMPYEVVRDFFSANNNYFDTLDQAAEAVALQARAQGGPLVDWLHQRMRDRHGVRVMPMASHVPDKLRSYDPGTRLLHLADSLTPGQQAFQIAIQLALLEAGDMIQPVVERAGFNDPALAALARISLAQYFAGALLLPYGPLLKAAEASRYDIDLLARHFGVGFETVCHRLSTLQRPDAAGVPFFFIRVDRAGNISKRQSATHFHFSRAGGTCPLWNVYEAFAQPGRILPQLARMPDGRTYLWVARTVEHGQRGYGAPGKMFSIGIGCDIRHAPRLVYSKGLDLADADAPTPIGMGCKVCERTSCLQRAFPFVGRPVDVDENQSRFAPYAVAEPTRP